MKDIISANIENLTSLWKSVSVPFQGYYNNNEYDYCKVPNSDWPNRLWFKEEVNEQLLSNAIDTIDSSFIPLVLSYWDDFYSLTSQVIEESGFVKKSMQIGMSLKLDKKFEEQNRLNIQLIDEHQAKIWAEIYPQSFGYRISDEILIRTHQNIQYYLVHFEDKPIGTAISFLTKNMVGIHGVGVIPEMRKRGFAEEIMHFILNRAIEQNIEYASLQSSAMGKGIYLKIGFSEDFLITNYILTKDTIINTI